MAQVIHAAQHRTKYILFSYTNFSNATKADTVGTHVLDQLILSLKSDLEHVGKQCNFKALSTASEPELERHGSFLQEKFLPND